MSYALTLRHHRSRSDSQIEERISYRLPKLPKHDLRLIQPVRRFHCSRRHDKKLADAKHHARYALPTVSHQGSQTAPEPVLVDETLREVLSSRHNEVQEKAYVLLCDIIRRRFRELKILTVDDFNEFDEEKTKQLTPHKTISLPKCIHVKLLSETEKRKRKVDEPTICPKCTSLRQRIQQTWRKYSEAVVYRTGGGYIRNPPISKKVKSTLPLTMAKDPFGKRDWQMPSHMMKDTRYQRPIKPPVPSPIPPTKDVVEETTNDSSYLEITVEQVDETDAGDATEDVLSSRISTAKGNIEVQIVKEQDSLSVANTTVESDAASIKTENESFSSFLSKGNKKKKKMMFGAKAPSEQDSIEKVEEEETKSNASIKTVIKSAASSKKSMFSTKSKASTIQSETECVCEAQKAEELRLEEERLKLEREEAEREAAAEVERLAAAAAEAERLAAIEAEAEALRIAEERRIERERIAAEEQRLKEEQRIAQEKKEEEERLEKERLAREAVEKELAEKERIAREAREKEDLRIEKLALGIFGEMCFAVKEELKIDIANEAYMEEMLGGPPTHDEFEEEALPQTPAAAGRETGVLSSRISSLSLSSNDISSPEMTPLPKVKSPPRKNSIALKKVAQPKKPARRMSKPSFMNKPPAKSAKKSARRSPRKAAPSTPSTASLPESLELELPTIPDISVSDEEAEQDPVLEEGRTITLPPLPEYKEFSRHNSVVSARSSSQQSRTLSEKRRMFDNKTPSSVGDDNDLQDMTDGIEMDDSAAVKLLARPKIDKLKKKKKNLSDTKAPLSKFQKKQKQDEKVEKEPEEENVLDFAARFCLISFNRLTKYEKVFKEIVKANPVKRSAKEEEEKEEKEAKMRIPGRETLSEELQKVISDFEKVQFSSDAYQERIANIHDKKTNVERQLDDCTNALYSADDEESALLMEKVNKLAKKLADLKEQGTQYAEKYKKLREKEAKLNEIISNSDIPQDVLNALERNTDALYKIFLKRKGHAMRKKDLWDALTSLDLKINRYEKKFMDQILGLSEHEDLDFKMFAIVASFAEKIDEMDSTVRGLIQALNVRELEKKIEQSRGLYKLVLENKGCYGKEEWLEATLKSVELDLQAGRIDKIDADSILSKLDQDGDGEVDFLDYCLYIPLFMMIHDKIVADPLN